MTNESRAVERESATGNLPERRPGGFSDATVAAVREGNVSSRAPRNEAKNAKPPASLQRGPEEGYHEPMDLPMMETMSAAQAPRSGANAQTLGQLGAQVAHDFNNILAVALTSIEMAMRIGDPARANVFLGNALKVIARGRVLTDCLSAAAHACEAQAPIDAREIVSRIADEIREDAPRIDLRIEDGAERSRVIADPRFIEEALRQVLANAREAMDHAGTLTVSTRNAPGSELRAEAGRDYFVIAVRDHGEGMAEETVHQAFDLFFSTKSRASETGRGVGLSQAKDAVRRAGGVVTMTSRKGEGTTVTLAIPLAAD